MVNTSYIYKQNDMSDELVITKTIPWLGPTSKHNYETRVRSQ